MSLFFTNGNTMSILALDVTGEAGANVRTTANAGLVMWSENDHTYVASYDAYTRKTTFSGVWGLSGDWIPHCWDPQVRRHLGVV